MTDGFLHNAWYMAAWSSEVDRTPMARTLLGMPVLLYRSEAGDPMAMDDICPHRFAPLSKGKLVGDAIECPYHGLRFARDGRCIHSPAPPAPGALRTRVYPVAEKDQIIWYWPGDPDRAADVPPPDHPELRPDPAFAIAAGGHLRVESDYRLVADNLLDLSHAEFLHPFLGNPGSISRTTFSAREEDGHIVATSDIRDEPVTGLIRMMWEGDVPERIDMLIDLHWRAPADMVLDLRVTEYGGAGDRAFISRQPHIVTPEAAGSCHYFFGNSRNMKIGIEALTAGVATSMKAVFELEDVPMIEAQHRYRAIAQARGMTMGMLRLDEAVVRANRHLDGLIAAEAAGH
ncbi:Rieske 2Fe-2S domain-containing protein [Novosphingobium sp. BL-52-GroH]|uniref:Rieske 2Fe-2S domain-containing protein n=1 Tax=Novosphingobium sp. BL-52-GroH TaxID=3349877 RepID=UPI0038506115